MFSVRFLHMERGVEDWKGLRVFANEGSAPFFVDVATEGGRAVSRWAMRLQFSVFAHRHFILR